MTHSLHRRGPLEDLKRDFVLMAMTSRVNRAEAQAALPAIAEIMLEVGPANIGSNYLQTSVPLGLDKEQFVRDISKALGLPCAFSSKEHLKNALEKLKEANLGVSITVAGVIDEVVSLAQELGLKPHTINLSMGILGKTERLADEDELQFTTMCGHAMIAASLVKKGLADIRCGAKTAREASMMLGAPCACGIYNLDLSEELLNRKIAQEDAPQSLG